MIQTDCYRDITKKQKIKGLSLPSWLMLIGLSFVCWFVLVLWVILVAPILYIFFFTLEYFDEDIYQIISKRTKIKSSKYYA
ncbi:VirB3 family type IV secretion system protein [uncultured Campylobacter sp.]|uniref:VirB3 family type IV secretion system protein n=1 Tax=uncultured Campylobacter sp. TaxID=218934 RepID=UPI003412E31B